MGERIFEMYITKCFIYIASQGSIWKKRVLQGIIIAPGIHYSPTGSSAAVKLEELLLKPQLLKDISKRSPKYQTSTLKAKHSLDIQFVP